MIVPSEEKEDQKLKLKKIQKDKSIYRVFFDNGKSFLCDENDIFEYKLYKDTMVTNEVFKKLDEKNGYYECLNDGIRIVNIKFFSSKQVQDRLLKNKHNEKDIKKVIEYLKSIGAIDDEEFFKSYVEYKSNQGYGPLYIKNKLFELGINRQVEIPYQRQYELIKKHFVSKNNSRLNKHVLIKKVKNKLITQGYMSDIIDDVINDIDFASNDDALKEEYIKLYDKYHVKYDEYQLKKFIKNKLLSKGYLLSEIEMIMEEGL